MHLIFAFGIFSIGYFLWARYIERNLNVDCVRPTPAIEKYDKVDFVPAKPAILFGHHFSSIAGVGPIVGPILALKYGWLPTFLWLVIGVVLIGAVHDFASLMVSVRNGGVSIGTVIEKYIGKIAGKLYLIFTFLTVILVVAIFTLIVAKAFAENPTAASVSIFVTALSPIFGFILRTTGISQFFAVLLGILFISLGFYLGYLFPLNLSSNTWIFLLLSYSFFASWLPVWLILQPRDYINFFLLFSFLILGVVGILVKRPEISIYALPENKNFFEVITTVFPFLFVTVACGSVSGFHSLVSSGTTSKQLSSECHARPIGYGAMLFESLLGVISMTALAIFSYSVYKELIGEGGNRVISAFAYGISSLSVGLDKDFVKNFAVLSLSAFALTSLDTACRIGRYLFEEIVESVKPSESNRERKTSLGIFSSFLVVVLAYLLLKTGGAITLWQLFGTSNQLLAGFALITAAVWAKKSNLKNYYFFIPAMFMFFITLSALSLQIKNFYVGANYKLLSVAAILFVSSVIVVVSSLRSYFIRSG